MVLISSYPSTEEVLLFATYLILIGSILAFAIYEFVSGVAFQVLLLLLGGVGFAFLIARNFFALPSSFLSFLGSFSIPLITDFVLVLIYMGTGLKLGLDAKQLRGSGLRIAAGGIAMAVADIVGSAMIFAYVCGVLLHWPWALGAMFGALIGDTSAAIVVPYLSHLTNLSSERAGKSEHMTKLTSVIKIESTMNSVILLLFVTIFYNQVSAGNASPALPAFLGTTLGSLEQVLAANSAVLLFVLVGIPIIIFCSSKIIVFFVKRRLADKRGVGMEPYAVLYLKTQHPTSTEDIAIHRSSDVTEFSEKQMRMGMMLYGIVLGIALLVFEEVLKITAFAGFANVLFALIALIYLGFFVGFLFPGGGTKSFESDASAQGKRTFTGMLLFHDEMELLARIVFYFSVGVELGTMLFSPPAGLQTIPANDIRGAVELLLLMIPIFICLRFFSGMFGLPIAFYSRRGHESFGRDFKLVSATMPKGVTVAAISVLLLQAGVQSGGTIYVLALSTIIVSTFAFTFASRAGSTVLKSPSRKPKRAALLSFAATKLIVGPEARSEESEAKADVPADTDGDLLEIIAEHTERNDKPRSRGRNIKTERQRESAGEIGPTLLLADSDELLAEKIYSSALPSPMPGEDEKIRRLEERLSEVEEELAEARRRLSSTASGRPRDKTAEDAKTSLLDEFAEIKQGIGRLCTKVDELDRKIDGIEGQLNLRSELKSGIAEMTNDIHARISEVGREIESLSERLSLERRLESKLEMVSSKLAGLLAASGDLSAIDIIESHPGTEFGSVDSTQTDPAVPEHAAAQRIRLRRVASPASVVSSNQESDSETQLPLNGGRSISRNRAVLVHITALLVGAAIYAGAFAEFADAGALTGYLLLIPGSVLVALGFSFFLRNYGVFRGALNRRE